MNKKEIYKKIFNNLMKLDDEEFFAKLKERENGDIANALMELGIAEYLWKEFKDKFENNFYIELIMPNNNHIESDILNLFTGKYFLEDIICEIEEDLNDIYKVDLKDIGLAA